MFGLDDDVRAAQAHLTADSYLAGIVDRQQGLRVIGGWDRFEVAVRVIVGQQISVVGATTITARIVERHGRSLPGSVLGLTHLFPTPDALIGLQAEGLGMPGSRVATIRALAAAVLDGTLDLRADPAIVRERLLTLPGVGPWTAEVIMMRAVRDPDAFPASDLGIRHAIAAVLGRAEPPPVDEVESLGETWRPYRALAAQHLWSSLRTISAKENS